MKQTVVLHHDDLKKIIKIIESLNPADDSIVGSGTITIEQHNSSGIGYITDAIVNLRMKDLGFVGEYKINIIDETSW